MLCINLTHVHLDMPITHVVSFINIVTYMPIHMHTHSVKNIYSDSCVRFKPTFRYQCLKVNTQEIFICIHYAITSVNNTVNEISTASLSYCCAC